MKKQCIYFFAVMTKFFGKLVELKNNEMILAFDYLDIVIYLDKVIHTTFELHHL